MRRHEQEITDRQVIEEILQKALICRIGLADNNMPYIVPVCFGYKDGSLYVHSSRYGLKMDMIDRNNNVCFEVEVDVETIPAAVACKWSVTYRSVVGFGKASVLENEEERIHALNIIMEHYTGKSPHEYHPHSLEKAAIIEIQVESMTGKRSIAIAKRNV
jgi:hypothetical protein